MKLEEVIDFLRTADDEACSKFIEERLQYLNENESGLHPKFGYCTPVEPRDNAAAIYRFILTDNESIISITNGPEGGYIFDESEVLSKMLIENIKKLNVNDIEGLFAATTKVVFDYFGCRKPVGAPKDRYDLVDESREKNPLMSSNGDTYGRFSAFKGTQKGWCHERSAIVHQLFKILGVESQIVTTPIIIERNGNQSSDAHSFNMIRIDGKTILIDTTMMNFVGEKDASGKFISGNFEPAIEILPYETFDTLKGGSLDARQVQNSDGTLSIVTIDPNVAYVMIKNANWVSSTKYFNENKAVIVAKDSNQKGNNNKNNNKNNNGNNPKKFGDE